MSGNKAKISVLTLILASMVISGCSNAAVQAETDSEPIQALEEINTIYDAGTYLGALKDCFHAYAESSYTFTDKLEAYNFTGARKSLDDMEASLKKLGSINAPEKYSYYQKKLADSLDFEYNYINNCRKFLDICDKGDSVTEADKAELDRLNAELGNVPKEFTDAYVETVKAVNADIKQE